jgi:hypothetical protein
LTSKVPPEALVALKPAAKQRAGGGSFAALKQ